PPILGRDWDERVAGGFPVLKPDDAPMPDGPLPMGPPGMPGMKQPAAMAKAGAGPKQPLVGQRPSDVACDLLLRFFDFTTDEGQAYRYGVGVVLVNPNHGLPAGVLTNIELGKGEFRHSDFSQPSNSVRVSMSGSEVLAGPVRPGRTEVSQSDTAT